MADVTIVEDRALDKGRDALRRRSWEEARRAFATALGKHETAEALEGYAHASWWLDDASATIDARSRAYALLRRQGDDPRGAARVATALAGDFGSFRGQPAVAEGWLGRARRLLDGLEPSAEHAWLALREAETAVFYRQDTAAARELLAKAASLAERLGLPDVEVVALALLGLALVTDGGVEEGMRLLDEAGAAISGGELSELEWVGSTYCCFIYAFEDVRDYERAAQWCDRLLEFCTGLGIRSGSALCRAHDAGVVFSRGAWPDAEAQLEAAAGELAATRPPLAAEALVRLGELRLRQGRIDDAAELFAQAQPHPRAARGRAAILLERDQAAEAAASLTALLETMRGAGRGERAAALELLVEAEIAAGRTPDVLVSELESIAADAGTPALTASARFAAGLAAAAAERHDVAVRSLEEAVNLFLRAGTPFEGAKARRALAESLAALGRRHAAREEARRASAGFEALGAEREWERAVRVLRGLEPRATPDDALGLSHRELEVVRLLAQGLSNREIAARLVVSEHTVKRHVANILRKLHVRSRAAVVARAAEADLI